MYPFGDKWISYGRTQRTAPATPRRPVPPGPLPRHAGALDALADAGAFATEYFHRHQCGDWGTVCEEDCRANEQALEAGARLISAYTLSSGVEIWIVTEADRSATTVTLPEEY